MSLPGLCRDGRLGTFGTTNYDYDYDDYDDAWECHALELVNAFAGASLAP